MTVSEHEIEYYKLHTCKTCADDSIPTPLEWAFGLIGLVRFEDQMVLLGSTTPNPSPDLVDTPVECFNDGWLVGVEGGTEMDGHMPPLVYQEYGDGDALMKAWLVGFLAGRYAYEFNWSSPCCKDDEAHGHIGVI